MKRFVRSALSELSYRTIRFTNSELEGIRILTYHRVNDWYPDDVLSVRIARFRGHMEYLAANNWRVIPLAEAVEQLSQINGVTSGPSTTLGAGKLQVTSDSVLAPRPLPLAPEKAVVLTFDDGYADNYWHAHSILRTHNYPATLFVASGLMDRHAPMPRYAKGVVRRDRGLSWNEIRDMQAGGIEIGAHSVTHAVLTRLSLEAARREIVESKQRIKQELGRPATAFAYPRGRFSAHVIRLVREAGFTSACSERIGANRPGEDLFRLRRTEISAFDTLDDFEKKLFGAFDWLHVAAQTMESVGVRG